MTLTLFAFYCALLNKKINIKTDDNSAEESLVHYEFERFKDADALLFF